MNHICYYKWKYKSAELIHIYVFLFQISISHNLFKWKKKKELYQVFLKHALDNCSEDVFQSRKLAVLHSIVELKLRGIILFLINLNIWSTMYCHKYMQPRACQLFEGSNIHDIFNETLSHFRNITASLPSSVKVYYKMETTTIVWRSKE